MQLAAVLVCTADARRRRRRRVCLNSWAPDLESVKTEIKHIFLSIVSDIQVMEAI
jgi:hypothetical protein